MKTSVLLNPAIETQQIRTSHGAAFGCKAVITDALGWLVATVKMRRLWLAHHTVKINAAGHRPVWYPTGLGYLDYSWLENRREMHVSISSKI